MAPHQSPTSEASVVSGSMSDNVGSTSDTFASIINNSGSTSAYSRFCSDFVDPYMNDPWAMWFFLTLGALAGFIQVYFPRSRLAQGIHAAEIPPPIALSLETQVQTTEASQNKRSRGWRENLKSNLPFFVGLLLVMVMYFLAACAPEATGYFISSKLCVGQITDQVIKARKPNNVNSVEEINNKNDSKIVAEV